MKIALISIFKNEQPYILEWLAYHRSIGFTDFIIGDNCSNDGTSELLDALHEARLINRVFQSDKKYCSEQGPQLDFYDQVIANFGNQYDVMGFIDADEFIYSETGAKNIVGSIEELFENPDISALGLNWRVFGVGDDNPDRLVTARITNCSRSDHPVNRYMKSFARPENIESMKCHFPILTKGRYVDTLKNELSFENGTPCEAFEKVVSGGLKVAHYIVKSEREFYNKKRLRGRAGVGADREDQFRDDEYFKAHSSYSREELVLARRKPQILDEISFLESLICQRSNYYKKAEINVESVSSQYIEGSVTVEGRDTLLNPVVVVRVDGLYEKHIHCFHDTRKPDINTYRFRAHLSIPIKSISEISLRLLATREVSTTMTEVK